MESRESFKPLAQQNAKQPSGRSQLSAGMQHLRCAVTIEQEPSAIVGLGTAEPGMYTSQDSVASDVTDPGVYGMPGYIQPIRKPRTESSQHNLQKRADPFLFGSRYLEEGDDIFAYNAWDHVETDEAYQKFAQDMYNAQRSDPVSEFDKKRFNDAPEKWWDKFYANNTSKFFKDRKWLHQEFPVLAELSMADSPAATILEIGAGAGNTAIPIIKSNKNPNLVLHACDFSRKAIEVLKQSHDHSEEDTIGSIHASVWDITALPDPETGRPTLPENLSPGSVDVIILIFIFSAIAPNQWTQALSNISHLLKPGGLVLFRDYGRGDLAQVRFKKGRYMQENFYVRGDGTRVYFFDEDELRRLWSGMDIPTVACSDGEAATSVPNVPEQSHESDVEDDASLIAQLSLTAARDEPSGLQPRFQIVNFGVDRRMLVNRQRRLKMYRCWMQGLFKKPE